MSEIAPDKAMVELETDTYRLLRASVQPGYELDESTTVALANGKFLVPFKRDTIEAINRMKIAGETFDQAVSRIIRLVTRVNLI